MGADTILKGGGRHPEVYLARGVDSQFVPIMFFTMPRATRPCLLMGRPDTARV